VFLTDNCRIVLPLNHHQRLEDNSPTKGLWTFKHLFDDNATWPSHEHLDGMALNRAASNGSIQRPLCGVRCLSIAEVRSQYPQKRGSVRSYPGNSISSAFHCRRTQRCDSSETRFSVSPRSCSQSHSLIISRRSSAAPLHIRTWSRYAGQYILRYRHQRRINATINSPK